jgi:hypothetical protein
MRSTLLRILVSWWILAVHSLAIVSAPFLLIDFNNALNLILILLPLTGLYVGIIVNYYATNITEDQNTWMVSKQFASITLFFVITFGVAVIGVQVLYYYGRIDNLDLLNKAVGVIDTGLGVYTGLLLKPLFGSK